MNKAGWILALGMSKDTLKVPAPALSCGIEGPIGSTNDAPPEAARRLKRSRSSVRFRYTFVLFSPQLPRPCRIDRTLEVYVMVSRDTQQLPSDESSPNGPGQVELNYEPSPMYPTTSQLIAVLASDSGGLNSRSGAARGDGQDGPSCARLVFCC